ncbi:MAG: hypothetical protein R3B96_16185 [Pirellulaceae bacterium]
MSHVVRPDAAIATSVLVHVLGTNQAVLTRLDAMFVEAGFLLVQRAFVD